MHLHDTMHDQTRGREPSASRACVGVGAPARHDCPCAAHLALSGGSLFADSVYEQDDREADAIWESIEDKMDERRAVRREKRLEQALRDFRKERPKITQQFADLKRYTRTFAPRGFRRSLSSSCGSWGLPSPGARLAFERTAAAVVLCAARLPSSRQTSGTRSRRLAIPQIRRPNGRNGAALLPIRMRCMPRVWHSTSNR